MTALAVFQAGAFGGGAELATVIFSAFRYACAGLNLAIAIRMGTRFFSHGYHLSSVKRGTYRATTSTAVGHRGVAIIRGSGYFRRDRCLLFSTEGSDSRTEFLLCRTAPPIGTAVSDTNGGAPQENSLGSAWRIVRPRSNHTHQLWSAMLGCRLGTGNLRELNTYCGKRQSSWLFNEQRELAKR